MANNTDDVKLLALILGTCKGKQDANSSSNGSVDQGVNASSNGSLDQGDDGMITGRRDSLLLNRIRLGHTGQGLAKKARIGDDWTGDMSMNHTALSGAGQTNECKQEDDDFSDDGSVTNIGFVTNGIRGGFDINGIRDSFTFQNEART